MTHCGIRNVIYLVEETNLVEALSFGIDAIQTAISQTQVVQEFFVKQTASAQETVSFLCSLTKIIEHKYKNQTLFGMPFQSLSKESFPFMRESLEKQLNGRVILTYSGFMNINSKTKTFTIHDIWIRQLLTIKGVSAEKASSIASKYPTCTSLVKALSLCKTNEEKESLLGEISSHNRRHIGPTLRKKIVALFDSDSYQ